MTKTEEAIQISNSITKTTDLFKVSVIIPVYNTEEFVEDAVRSVMNQTLQEIEIIIINDGSTDNSQTILDKLATEDNRISIYKQQNEGLSITRNRGLSLAIGKYVYFMDSDDFLESDALNYCYKRCEEKSLDLICFDADILNKENFNQVHLQYTRKEYTDENRIYNGIDLLNILLNNKCYTPSACLSLINRSYLKRINLSFFPKIIHEDQLFTAILYMEANRIMCIHQQFFKRRLRENSIMTNNFSMRNVESYFIIADQLSCYKVDSSAVKKTVDKYLFQMLDAVAWLSYKLPLKERLFITGKCLRQYRKYVSTRNLFVLIFKSYLKK